MMSSAGLARTLRSLCIAGDLAKAVGLLCRSQVCPGAGTYAFLLQECVNRRDARMGKRIHARMVSTGFGCGVYIVTKLLIFYVKIGELCVARKLFDGMPQRSVVAWNAMISGCARGGVDAQAVEMFGSMRAEGMRPDQFTFASVLCACARLASLGHGRRVHGVMVKSRVGGDGGGNIFVDSALVDMYLKCSSPKDARRAFAAAPAQNVIMWTAVISGHGQHGRVAEALALFDQMTRVDGLRPNDVTFLAVLSACAHAGLVDEGLRHFLSMSSDYGLTPRGEHYAAAVDMLARVGRLRDAYELVKNLPDCQEHSVVWGALLGAGRKHGDVRLVELAALRFFRLQLGTPASTSSWRTRTPRARCGAAWPARTRRCGRWESRRTRPGAPSRSRARGTPSSPATRTTMSARRYTRPATRWPPPSPSSPCLRLWMEMVPAIAAELIGDAK